MISKSLEYLHSKRLQHQMALRSSLKWYSTPRYSEQGQVYFIFLGQLALSSIYGMICMAASSLAVFKQHIIVMSNSLSFVRSGRSSRTLLKQSIALAQSFILYRERPINLTRLMSFLLIWQSLAKYLKAVLSSERRKCKKPKEKLASRYFFSRSGKAYNSSFISVISSQTYWLPFVRNYATFLTTQNQQIFVVEYYQSTFSYHMTPEKSPFLMLILRLHRRAFVFLSFLYLDSWILDQASSMRLRRQFRCPFKYSNYENYLLVSLMASTDALLINHQVRCSNPFSLP